jgi:hypothetical protein
MHPAGHSSHHVTIQRLLSTQEVISHNLTSPSTTTPESTTVQKSSSLTRIKVSPISDTPLLRAVHAIDFARENTSCPPEIKELLDKCIDILRSTELFAPPVPARGWVAGLLDVSM